MTNPRFQIRQSEEELEELDKALIAAGYTKNGKPDRAGWFREVRRNLIKESKDVYYETK